MVDLPSILADPKLYGRRNRTTRVITTLVNYVVITDHFVYKFKQPIVHFHGGIDYRTLAKRQKASRKEFSFNKRMCPYVHLNIVDVRRLANGTYTIGHRGALIERGFRMRRLPESCLVSELIRRHKITTRDGRRLVTTIRRLHADLPRPRRVRPYAQLPFITKRWVEILRWMNEAHVRRMVPTSIRTRLPILVDQLDRLAPILRRRGPYAQRIHGDLNTENIFYFHRHFYCVDPNQFMVEWEYGDPLNDLGAVLKDFDAFSQDALADKIARMYLGQKVELRPVLIMYKVYWAAIRYLVYADILGRHARSTWSRSDVQRKKRFERLLIRYVRHAKDLAAIA